MSRDRESSSGSRIRCSSPEHRLEEEEEEAIRTTSISGAYETHERLSHRVGYRAGIEQAGNAKRDVQANGELVLELEKLMAREEAIREKWQHELASPTVSAGAKGLTGTSDLCESLHKANDENEERHAKERTRPAEGSAHPSTSTNIGSREERTELSSRVAEEIMQGRRSFLKHRELVEAPLHGTGMSQHQIIESIADLIFEGSLQEVALERGVKLAEKKESSKPKSVKASWPTSVEKKRDKPTVFQQRVYDLISTIPAGKVSTYGEVARELGSSPRAVGNALRNNPFAPVVPCHRVVASTRALGGFSGQKGHGAPKLREKRAILEREGVVFEAPLQDDVACTVDPCALYFFPSPTALSTKRE
ncbi:Methylated-DNA--protein-cysteine methyltransferase [Hondaea fermentalgiana]|uniref:Methylated-DNA--protein-cysteine methyltransferase n=1 Tax=Hondaea fermentalgiana TaxID=2315210 RepID=A0A2R5G6K5_9STRA|nr:Methylated-DNA--protein-cysteine methyltransferase [Hondaea fermentalgiana]|eukprot:GBG25959.1 Methylated-DNA--protein-cysteine methyltransferase [Hondaea fermentalgiana]